MQGDRVVSVVLLGESIHVGLGVAHLEEVVEFGTAERVVPVLAHEGSLVQRLLDVPEEVGGNGLEDGLVGRLSEAIGVSLLEILNEGVLLVLLEDTELLVERGMELLDVERSLLVLELLNKSETEGLFVFLIKVPDVVSLDLSLLVELLLLLLVRDTSLEQLSLGDSVEDGTVLITSSTIEGIGDLLEERAALESTRSGASSEGLDLGNVRVVGLNRLLVVIEILVLVLALSDALGVFQDMVSDVNVAELDVLLVLVAVSDVLVDLGGDVLLLLGRRVGTVKDSMLHLEVLETNLVVPVAVELLNLLRLEEMRLRHLLTPEGSMTERELLRELISGVGVLDTLLVEQGPVERPDVVLISAVIDERNVVIRRVRVHRLTLNVVVVEGLIVILQRDDGRSADDVLFIRLELLEALELISVRQSIVIDIREMRRVVSDTLMVTHEGVVNAELGHGTLPEHR